MTPAPHLVAVLLAAAIAGPGANRPRADSIYVFQNVTLLPLTGSARLERHTVVVSAGRIATIGPAGEITVPPNATIIDATGKFLIPGLADMHVHLPGADSSGVATRNSLALFLANGATEFAVQIAAVFKPDLVGPLQALRMMLRGAS